MGYKEFYRRNLPHWQPLGGTLFVTCCLAGSLPQSIIDWYEREKQRLVAQRGRLLTSERARLERNLQRRWFARIEAALHKAETGPTWLKNDSVARLVTDNLHFHDGKTYRLDAYCIMPNHAHLVLMPLQIMEQSRTEDLTPEVTVQERAQAGSLRYVKPPEPKYYALAKIMHTLKSYTANKANILLSRSGEFWQHESYDHTIRDQQERARVVAYVLNNPVKAGLVTQWPDWPFTYLREQS